MLVAMSETKALINSAAGPGLPLQEAANIEIRRYSVPCNVYGAAAVLPRLLMDSSQANVATLLYFGTLIANYFFQFFLISMVIDVVIEKLEAAQEGECAPVGPIALAICMAQLHFRVLMEVVETLDLGVFCLYHLPSVSWTMGKPLLFKEGEGRELEIESGGFSTVRKAMIFAFILLPKAIISLMMFFVGGWFLVVAVSEEELLLNALALAFIFEIDEVLFCAISPQWHQRVLEAMPPMKANRGYIWRDLLGSAVKILFVIATVSLCMFLLPRCGWEPQAMLPSPAFLPHPHKPSWGKGKGHWPP